LRKQEPSFVILTITGVKWRKDTIQSFIIFFLVISSPKKEILMSPDINNLKPTGYADPERGYFFPT